ncbi:MAG: hypothetical protein L6V93_07845 [Clostridiales bacterium]|nr:MAG: hypothetical protein L6V93_07845 [Clostridiales bacterium]
MLCARIYRRKQFILKHKEFLQKDESYYCRKKPSLARNIVSAITNMKTKGGYYEGNGYIVTWAFGHLFRLQTLKRTIPRPRARAVGLCKNLPCFPEKFKFELKKRPKQKKVDTGVRNQFETIKTALRARGR